ncbi:hypothetical protein AB0K34_40600 [Actinomadura sp. NPDC049382]|uniref:hypothetical protein n=1 Tax=Actinomadura sp. NPDC049382 TaxID=3158220 RepID=UPI0034184985
MHAALPHAAAGAASLVLGARRLERRLRIAVVGLGQRGLQVGGDAVRLGDPRPRRRDRVLPPGLVAPSRRLQ